MDWDGTGLHPVLKMTMEEIRAMNEAISDKYAGQRAKAPDAIPHPSFEEQVAFHNSNLLDRLKSLWERLQQSLKGEQL